MSLHALSWFLLGVSCSMETSNPNDQQIWVDKQAATSNVIQVHVNDENRSFEFIDCGTIRPLLSLDGAGE